MVRSWNEIRNAATALASIFILFCALAANGAHLAPWGGDANAPFNVGISASADEPFLEWSAEGELIAASNSAAAETFNYDACGRLASAETRIGTNVYATTWLRDVGGLVTNISYGAGFSVSREYDADGRIIAVRDGLGHEWTFAYDGEGKPLGGTSPDGRGQAFSYDAAGRLSSWSVEGIAGRSIVRDTAGRRIRDTVTAGAMPVPSAERRAQNVFDGAGRLVSAEVACGTNAPIHEVYLHDCGGAMTNATANGECIFSAQYDALGRLMSLGGPSSSAAAFSYDAIGNRIVVGDRIFIPDHDDPLKRPLLECDADGTPRRAYIWGANRLLGFIDMVGRDAPIAPPSLAIAHCDEQGAVIALTSADGTILHTAHYGPHGEDWGASGENPTPFAWLGGLGVMRQPSTLNPQPSTLNSQLSPLYLTRHRLYAPTLRRFLSSDPIGLSGGLNLYGYCSGDPLSYIDPLGLMCTRIGGALKMLGGGIETVIGYGFAAYTAVSGVGMAAGIAVGLHGTDVAIAGFNELLYGVPQDTLTSQGLQTAGLPQDSANGIDAGLSMVGTMGVGAAFRAPVMETVSEGSVINQNTTVYRIWGGESKAFGHSWTPQNPLTMKNPRDFLGLPSENSGRFLSTGVIKDINGVSYRPALPYGVNRGGGAEWLVPDASKQIKIINIQGVNPEF